MKEMTFEEFADIWGPRFGTKEALWLADHVLQGIWGRVCWIVDAAIEVGKNGK